MRQRIAGALFLVGALVLAGCGQTAPAPPEILQLTLLATDIAYDQSRIEAVAGQPLRITLQNDGLLEHDFSIMEIPHSGEIIVEEAAEAGGHDMDNMAVDPEVHVAAPPTGASSIEFTPSQPGEYEYFCTVEGHKAAGMIGTLVVRDS